MKTLAIRHGELVLLPVENKDMSGAKLVKCPVLSHSETGHHHVLECDCMLLDNDDATFIELKEASKLVHKKSVDRHADLHVKEGIYKVMKKKEYDPFDRIMKEVRD